ncbi:phosphotransferase [Corynebacterium gerontici]|uniref:Maltokinase n=1 Tax=Corynebacterium gerontici TaxID=2079234 RepID=A0A3G6J1M4_9CORY|nr:phosphotransferase [Corynebacterium gerontici]AZA11897.1 Maltokinase [Corynebacterium gerontici]
MTPPQLSASIADAQWELSTSDAHNATFQQTLKTAGRDVLKEPEYAAALLALWAEDHRVELHGVNEKIVNASVQLEPLRGEQTNASLRTTEPNATVWKFYRTIAPGTHPDVEVPRVVHSHVAEYRGHASMLIDGHEYTLAAASQLIPNAIDAWKIATSEDHRLVEEQAGAMGSALADVHQDLASGLSTGTMAAEEFAAHLRSRAHGFIQQAEELQPFAERIDHIYDQLSGEIGTQRIHGDLHLGQVLWSDQWYFVDFEGEPDVDIQSRTKLMPAAYDVAGLIRSYHYAGLDYPEQLVRAYGRIDDVVLRACLIDRFCYEVAYEKRHRPDWVKVPLRGADDLF